MVTNFHGADSEVLASMETNWFGNQPFETTWFDWIIWAIYRKYRISNTSVYTPKLRALSMCSACTNMAFTCFLQCCCFRSRTWWALHRENRHIPLLRTDLGYWPGFHFTSHFYRKSCFLSLFIFRLHSTREPASNRMTYFILRAYTGTGVSHSQQEKVGRGFGRKCRWMDRKGRNMHGRNPWQ